MNDADQFLGGARGTIFAYDLHHLTVDAIFDKPRSMAVQGASGGLLEQLNICRKKIARCKVSDLRRGDQVSLSDLNFVVGHP